MIYQGGYTPKSTQVSRTVESQGRDCWAPMSLSLVVSRSAVCTLPLHLLLLSFHLPPTPFLLFFLLSFPPVLSHQHESGAPGVQSPTSCSRLCLPHLQLLMPGCFCLLLILSVFFSLFSFLSLSLHWAPLTFHPQCLLSIQYRLTRGWKTRKCVSHMLLHAWQGCGCESLMKPLKALRCTMIMLMCHFAIHFMV